MLHFYLNSTSEKCLSGPKDVRLLILGVRINIYPKGAIASEKQRRERVCVSVCVCVERERDRLPAGVSISNSYKSIFLALLSSGTIIWTSSIL